MKLNNFYFTFRCMTDRFPVYCLNGIELKLISSHISPSISAKFSTRAYNFCIDDRR